MKDEDLEAAQARLEQGHATAQHLYDEGSAARDEMQLLAEIGLLLCAEVERQRAHIVTTHELLGSLEREVVYERSVKRDWRCESCHMTGPYSIGIDHLDQYVVTRARELLAVLEQICGRLGRRAAMAAVPYRICSPAACPTFLRFALGNE